MNAAERHLAARIAAHESWAHTPDRTARTAPARAALDQKFLEQADGDPVRAGHLRKAYFSRLALKSAQSRRKARELTGAAEAAEAELAEEGGPMSLPERESRPVASGPAQTISTAKIKAAGRALPPAVDTSSDSRSAVVS